MFGLEAQKKKKKGPGEFVFPLEDEFRNKKKHQELKTKVENKIQRIKDTLRSGDSKEEFDKFGVLLHGYTSLLKVMARFVAK